MGQYKHLNYGERVTIATLRAEKKSYSAIDKIMHRSVSTIHNEVHRNSMRPDVTNHTEIFPYQAEYAQVTAEHRRSRASRQKVKLTKYWQKVINHYLRKKWSLEQISHGSRVPYSTNTLYSYAKDGYLRYQAQRYKRRKKKHYHGVKTDREIFTIHHISKRSQKIEKRTEFGHWEVDGIEGSRGSQSMLLSFLERKTRCLILVKARSKTNKSIHAAMGFFFKFYGRYVKSCTFDRGSEFTNYSNVLQVTHQEGKKIYFTDAFAPWQRGSNEERNKRVREYYPKGSAFGHEIQVRLNAVSAEINNKPMKIFNWRSPATKFAIEKRKLARQANQ
ncbi:IS30 family transposase [Leuconostoc citreum]|uniref:IS30 family transposase n=1 Tax=Leuconostoc citreum TaxID=33964 RepID=UPI0032DE4EC2